MRHYLANWSIGLGAGAIGAGLLSVPAGALLGLGAAYYGKMSEDLTHVHELHPKSKLYLDVNKAAVYTIAIYKG